MAKKDLIEMIKKAIANGTLHGYLRDIAIDLELDGVTF